MEPSRRFQLLWQSETVHLTRGEELFPADEPPSHVLIIFEGNVSVFGELPAERGPVLLDELGPGDCVGWSAALAGVPGVCAVITSDVDGLRIPAPAFLEITRYDRALKEAMFSKPLRAEVWHAVLCEMERRTGRVRSARAIVDALLPECVARDWPEEEAEIAEMQDFVWVVVGGEGVRHGDRWNDGEGVLWARVIGLPAAKLNAALTASAPPEPKPAPVEIPAPKASAAVKPVAPPAPSSRVAPPKSERTFVQPAAEHEQPPRKRGRSFLAMAAGVVLVGSAVAWWAKTQPVTRPITLPGRLLFAGETRPLKPSVAGTIVEWNLRQGQRVQAGEVLAVVKPPFDEAVLRTLGESLARARSDVIFCEAFLAGVPSTETGVSPDLADMVREHARLLSEARVHSAIVSGQSNATGLSQAERMRVNSYYASFKNAEDARVETAVRDTSTRFEDLREAEASLREAQEELRVHKQSFSEVTSDDKNEAARERADFQRMVAVYSKQVAQRQEVVNRLRREIQVMRAEVEPAVAVPIDGSREQLTRVQAQIAAVEEQFRARLQAVRALVKETEESLAKSRTEAAPRQIISKTPGLVAEVAELKVGAPVLADSPLAQLVTREQWQVECSMPAADLARLRTGQTVRVTYLGADGKQAAVSEPLALTNGGQPRLKLQGAQSEWREGMQVLIETEFEIGTLLDQWLGRLNQEH